MPESEPIVYSYVLQGRGISFFENDISKTKLQAYLRASPYFKKAKEFC